MLERNRWSDVVFTILWQTAGWAARNEAGYIWSKTFVTASQLLKALAPAHDP